MDEERESLSLVDVDREASIATAVKLGVRLIVESASSISCFTSSLEVLREPCLDRNCVPLGVVWPSVMCVDSSTKAREFRFEAILLIIILVSSESTGDLGSVEVNAGRRCRNGEGRVVVFVLGVEVGSSRYVRRLM
jgi:hypothetical protein